MSSFSTHAPSGLPLPQQEEGRQGNRPLDDDGTTDGPEEETADLLHSPVQEVGRGLPKTEDVVQRSTASEHGTHILGTATDYTHDHMPIYSVRFVEVTLLSVIILGDVCGFCVSVIYVSMVILIEPVTVCVVKCVR